MTGWLRRQLRITWHLPFVLAVLSTLALVGWKWNALTSHPPRIVRLSGAPYEMGRQHGALLSKEISELYEAYVRQGIVKSEGWKESDLIEVGRHYDRFIPERFREEMRGISDGSHLSYDQILVMNTFADALLGKTPRACSAFAVRTSDGLLVGRNLDWVNYGIAHRTGVVFLIQPNSQHSFLSVAWPGMVGVITGMNDQGITISLNLAYAGDLTSEATPALFRLRGTLETQATLKGAIDDEIREPRTMASNLLIASGKENDAVALELSGQQHAVVQMQQGHVVTTNYYQLLPIHGGSGGDRTAKLHRFLAETGMNTTLSQAQSALADVCFLGFPAGMVTNQSVVMMPSKSLAYVAGGKIPATSARYYPVSLK